MRNLILGFTLITGLIVFSKNSFAQIEQPVHWSYGTKKLDNGMLEIHLLATIDAGWHIYSQKKTKESIAISTSINFNTINGMTLIDKPIENGKMAIYRIKEIGITNYEYANKVDFVQKVKLGPGVKEIKGTIVFQSCTREKCLPAETVNFNIPVNN